MSDELKKLDLSDQTKEKHPATIPLNYLKSGQIRETEDPLDQAARLAEATHKRWRESGQFIVKELLLKPLILITLVYSAYYAANVLSNPNASSESKDVAKSSITLILGGLVGFAIGKADK